MTDARLLCNPEVLLRWSASLDYRRVTFDQWLASEQWWENQTGGFDVGPYEPCKDNAGHSVRVAEVAGKVAG